MTQGFFVTGTDTNVGKTIASAWLTLHTAGIYWKPIQTGTKTDPMDQETVGHLIGYDHTLPTPYIYAEPLAPLHAAEREDKIIPVADLHLPVNSRPLIVEGAGGALVPLTQTCLMVDLMAQFQLPIVVVARTTLGTINHTLLTIEALRRRDLPIAGIIFNGPEEKHAQSTIERLAGVPIMGHIPFISSLTKDHLQRIKPWVNLTQV